MTQTRTRRFDRSVPSTSRELGLDPSTLPADLAVSDVVRLLEHGRKGSPWAWGLCRSAAGYWTAYTDGRIGDDEVGAFLVPTAVGEAVLDAGWLVPIDVYASGATLYALAEEPDDREGRPAPPRSGDRPAAAGRGSVAVADAVPAES